MENLLLTETSFTPRVMLNADTGILELSGRSTSENALDFYRPIISWIREYCKTPSTQTLVTLHLDYFNSSSSKCLLDIIRAVSKIQSSSHTVTINWMYHVEDIDMKETGEDLESLARVPFKIVEVRD